MNNIGKKISCLKCNTKLFTFNKDIIICPVCGTQIQTDAYINHHNNKVIEEDYEEDINDLSDSELLKKVTTYNSNDILSLSEQLEIAKELRDKESEKDEEHFFSF